MRKRTTILDVANAAGVSKATVSRVLAGDYPVSEATAKRVMEAVDELGYTASSRARSLATGRSDAFAIVVSEPLDIFFADPTFALLMQGIVAELQPTPIVPILLPASTPAEQQKLRRLATSQAVDALIHLSPWADGGLLSALESDSLPVVLCGQDERFSPERFSFVYSDDSLGAREAATRLRAIGRSRPVAILGKEDQPAARDRFAGYRDVFPDLARHRVRWGGWSEHDGALAMRDLLASGTRFDSLLAASDRIARGAISEMELAGLRVPADVAVIGYDDHPTATSRAPELTTVAQPMHEQGRVACRTAMSMVDGQAPTTALLPTELVLRQTA